jgi:hypothetical protein
MLQPDWSHLINLPVWDYGMIEKRTREVVDVGHETGARPTAAANDPIHIVHELGHIWDANTGLNGGPLGVIGGIADSLNDFIGGNITKGANYRWINLGGTIPSSHIPNNFQYGPENKYANGSTADYFADSFKFAVFEPEILSPTVNLFIESQIKFESISLP